MLKKIFKICCLAILLGEVFCLRVYAAKPVSDEDKAKASTQAKVGKLAKLKEAGKKIADGAKSVAKGVGRMVGDATGVSKASDSVAQAKGALSKEGIKAAFKKSGESAKESGRKLQEVAGGRSEALDAAKKGPSTAQDQSETAKKALTEEADAAKKDQQTEKVGEKTPEEKKEADRQAQLAKQLPLTPPEKAEAEKKEAEKKAAEALKEMAIKDPANYLKSQEYLSKTPEEKIKYLNASAATIAGAPEDPADMSPIEKDIFKFSQNFDKWMPGLTVSLKEASLKVNLAVQNSWAGRLQAKSAAFSQKVKSEAYGSRIFGKQYASDKDVEALRKTPEGAKKWKETSEAVKKDLVAEYEKSMSAAEAAKKADKELEKETKRAMKSSLAAENLEKIVAKKISDLETKDPKKLAKMMEKITKNLEGDKKGSDAHKGLAEKIQGKEFKVEDFNKLDISEKQALVKDIVKESIKNDMKKRWYDKYQDDSQNRRQKLMGFKPQGIAFIIGTSFQVIASLVGLVVAKEIKNAYGTPLFSGESQAPAVAQAENSYSDEKLTPEDQKKLDAFKKLSTYYSDFDKKFKNILSSFDYDTPVFQTAEKVKFAGGEMTAGMALLFDYKGAGNIADGLTPITVRFYPLHILGNVIDPTQALIGVSNFDALELIGSLRSCSPDVIFLIKAISLLNTANKKFTDVVQRNVFLSEQMNLLLARLLRTVDDDATRRANIIEKDDEKWVSVYMKRPSHCFLSAPKVLRDYISELTVDILDESGKTTKTSFEQYVVDQFNIFDDVLNVEFEGDVDYQDDAETKVLNSIEDLALDDDAIKLKLYAIFMRALDDVLRLEKKLFGEKAPVTIKDAQGKSQIFDSKKFYMDVTKVAFDNFQKAQKSFIDVTFDLASDITDAENLKKYNSVYKNYMQALDVYSRAELEFRKKTCFYPFEKTLGYQPETVFDFVKRECKRAYQQALNKQYFISVLPKIFEHFAENFPFSTSDLLMYSQEPGPVKSPARLFVAEALSQAPNSAEAEKTEATNVQVPAQVLDKAAIDKKNAQVPGVQKPLTAVLSTQVPVNSTPTIAQDKEKAKDVLGVTQVRPKGKMIRVVPAPEKTPERASEKTPDKVV